MNTTVLIEKCRTRGKGKKVSFRMRESFAKDFELLKVKRPLVSQSKMLNEATSLLLSKYEGVLSDVSDLPLLERPAAKAKRPTSAGRKKAKMKPKRKKTKVKVSDK